MPAAAGIAEQRSAARSRLSAWHRAGWRLLCFPPGRLGLLLSLRRPTRIRRCKTPLCLAQRSALPAVGSGSCHNPLLGESALRNSFERAFCVMLYFVVLFSQVLSTLFLEKGTGLADIRSVIGQSPLYFYAVVTFSCCGTSSTKETGKAHLGCSDCCLVLSKEPLVVCSHFLLSFPVPEHCQTSHLDAIWLGIPFQLGVI